MHLSSKRHHIEESGILLGGIYCFPYLDWKGLGGYGMASHYPLYLSLEP